MTGVEVSKRVTVEINLDGRGWELYAATYPDGCDMAAYEINEAIMAAVNAGLGRSQVRAAVDPVFKRFAHLGALDTEPRWRFTEVLDEIFGELR